MKNRLTNTSQHFLIKKIITQTNLLIDVELFEQIEVNEHPHGRSESVLVRERRVVKIEFQQSHCVRRRYLAHLWEQTRSCCLRSQSKKTGSEFSASTVKKVVADGHC